MSMNVLQTSANDIGSIVKATMSQCDIDTTIQQLSTEEKCMLLKHYNKHVKLICFPYNISWRV